MRKGRFSEEQSRREGHAANCWRLACVHLA